MLAEATVMSFWPSDTVSLAIIGLVTMFVKDYLDRSRQAKCDTKVESVVQSLAVQDKDSGRREDKLDQVARHVQQNTEIAVQAVEKLESVAVAGEALKTELVEAVTQAAADKGTV